MGLIEDISRFLETRLEEFIRNNPQMELRLLEDKLQEQEAEIVKLIVNSEIEEKKLQDQILAIAEEIRTWHERVTKAESYGRTDLANAARDREAALLRQGNQVWAQMELVKKRLADSRILQKQIQERRVAVKAKIAEAAKAAQEKAKTQSTSTGNSTNSNPYTVNWDNLSSRSGASGYGEYDDLDAKFRELEAQEELDALKRKMGRK
ncbi:MAG: TIGR04376 family protein [Pseudanabaena sp. ELA607]